MHSKTSLDVIDERLSNHIEADEKAWAENKEMLGEMNEKLTIACDWITEQKAKISFTKYAAGAVGGIIVLLIDKVWP